MCSPAAPSVQTGKLFDSRGARGSWFAARFWLIIVIIMIITIINQYDYLDYHDNQAMKSDKVCIFNELMGAFTD